MRPRRSPRRSSRPSLRHERPDGSTRPPSRTPLRTLVARRVDPAAAREVAAAYDDARERRDPLTRAAYARLVAESDRLFGWMTSPDRADPVRVAFTACRTPYDDARELIDSVRDERTLEVATVATDAGRRHPLMGSDRGGAYDRFRAVHDVLGHACLGLGFDRDAEFTAWRWQERLHSPLAHRALATELHGQHSVLWTTGRVAEPKAVLLDPELVERSRRRARPTEPSRNREARVAEPFLP